MAKYKLKKKVKNNLIKLFIIVILLIVGIILIKDYKYKQTYEYKLLNLNYSKEEIKVLLDNLNRDKIDELLTKEYNKDIVSIINEKYYLSKNLDRYLNYLSANPTLSYSDVVSLVNVNRDNKFYENTTATDLTNYNEMLVNKYHLLNKDFQANDIVNVSSTYGYANNSLNKEAYEAFKQLANDAKKEGHTIVILSSYRTYEYQEKLWNRDKDDDYVARPGSSEHITGLAIDVSDYNDKNDSFKDTESYTWMINNCYKYGFILRYPENKENITGYSYEAWHYRYVGTSLATKIYNEGITFDEYYAYYMEK